MPQSNSKMQGSKTKKIIKKCRIVGGKRIKNKKDSGSKQNKNLCTRCKAPKLQNCDTAYCNKCKEEIKKYNQIKRDKLAKCMAIKQDEVKCTNVVSEKCGNKFCEKHIVEWKEYQETGGKEVRRCNSRTQCNPENPGVKAILPDGYTKKKCEPCLIRERQKDKELRNKKKDFNEKLIESDSNFDARICTECPITKKYTEAEMGLKLDGTRSHLCQHHYEMQQKAERNRKQRYRVETRNDDELEIKREKRREKIKTDPKELFKEYIATANANGRNFELSFEEFEKIVMANCYYCDKHTQKYLHGVDRVANDLDYTKDNVVTACTVCNLMKSSLNIFTFILMCAHIAHHNKILKLKLFPQVFNDYKTADGFLNYKNKTINKRKMNFDLTEEEFNQLRQGCCYICGRESSETHCNGIDRYDNNEGYILKNCRSCCGDCNFLKGKQNYQDFILKCAFIADTHKDLLDKYVKKWKSSIFHDLNKKKIRLITGLKDRKVDRVVKHYQRKNNKKNNR